jgi:flagellar motor component MotA
MTKRIDFTVEEWELLHNLPLIVVGTSLAAIHASVFKTLKTAFSMYAIVLDTSKQFPDNECIQEIFTAGHEKHEEHNQLIENHQGRGKEAAIALRNDMSIQAIKILCEKSQPQESEEYRQWLLLISREMMLRVESQGFLSLGKERAETEVAQALQDFARVLQISE